MAKVIVVGFRLFDLAQDKLMPQTAKTTKGKLAQIEGAAFIPGTEETVDEKDLDTDGFYHFKS